MDGEDKADWVMHYVPGPKAKAEYHAFTRSGRIAEVIAESAADDQRAATAAAAPKRRAYAPRQRSLRFEPAEEGSPSDHPLVAGFTKRGIGESKARALLAVADVDSVMDQLEWGDSVIAANRAAIRNPAGFYIHLVSEKVTPPDDFETSRKRKLRETAAAERQRRQADDMRLEQAYHEFRREAIDRYIAGRVPPDQFEGLVSRKSAERRRQWPLLPAETIRQMAEREARAEYGKLASVPSFEAFAAEHRGAILRDA